MTNEIAQAPLADRLQYAQALSQAKLLPEQFRGKPADVLLAIEWGAALGMEPMQAINSIFVVNGRPSLTANALAALVRRAGHRMRVVGDDKTATASIWRKDDPDFEYRVQWTLEMAKQAGLMTGKDNWSKYPAAMLKARAQTAVVRDACPELIIGLPGGGTDDDASWAAPQQPAAGELGTPASVDPETGEILGDVEPPSIESVTADIERGGLDDLRRIWSELKHDPRFEQIKPVLERRVEQLHG